MTPTTSQTVAAEMGYITQTSDPIARLAQATIDDRTADMDLDPDVIPFYAYLDASERVTHPHSLRRVVELARIFADSATL